MSVVSDLLQAIRKIVLLEDLLRQSLADQQAMREDLRTLNQDLNLLAREVAELRGKYENVENRVIDQLELRLLRSQLPSSKSRKLPKK
jgi:hypothetical protein